MCLSGIETLNPCLFRISNCHLKISTAIIQITITTNEEATAVTLAKLLINENLAINSKIIDKVRQYTKKGNDIIANDSFMLIALTRLRLFSLIETRLKETFPEKEIEFYSVPVVEMDWEKAESLENDI